MNVVCKDINASRASCVVAAALVCLGCSSCRPPTAATHAALVATLKDIRDATVSGIYLEPVRLDGGTYEAPPYVPGSASRARLTLWDAPLPSGSVRGASGLVTAALLSESSGGSGERVYLVAFGMDRGALRQLGAVLVGDRTKVRSATIADGQIALEVIESGPGEPACCGTQLARKAYELAGETLVLSSSRVTGRLSLAAASGVTWKLVSVNDRATTPPHPTVTFASGRISGFGGCGSYAGDASESRPGHINIAHLRVDKADCDESGAAAEAVFLEQLSRAEAYTFLATRLALSGRGPNGPSLLLFESETAR